MHVGVVGCRVMEYTAAAASFNQYSGILIHTPPGKIAEFIVNHKPAAAAVDGERSIKRQLRPTFPCPHKKYARAADAASHSACYVNA